MGEGMHAGGWLWMLLMAIVAVIPFWRICTRAGFPGALSLLILVPLVNVGFVYFLAFARWPAQPRESTNRPTPGLGPPHGHAVFH